MTQDHKSVLLDVRNSLSGCLIALESLLPKNSGADKVREDLKRLDAFIEAGSTVELHIAVTTGKNSPENDRTKHRAAKLLHQATTPRE